MSVMLSFVARSIVLAGLLTSAFLLMGSGRGGEPSTHGIHNGGVAIRDAMGGAGGDHPISSSRHRRQQQTSSAKKFKVLERGKHDGTSFVQGLSYGDDGKVYETTGLYGQSKVRRINPITFEVELSVDMDDRYFGEGSTYYRNANGDGRLIVLSWRERTGFIYGTRRLRKFRQFEYETTSPNHEGWGIAYDESRREFIVSDGTEFLYFWDRDTLAVKRRVTVTRLDGNVQDNLNELAYMGGLICCNIWYSDTIICVNPTTGKSVREYDMSSLWPTSQGRDPGNVLNGIAVGKDHVLLTGKNWDRMYKVEFTDWPTLF